MIVEALSVRGFSSAFASSTATLDMTQQQPGVFAWCGPNGAGKTTAMESVTAALYRVFPSYGYGAAQHVAPGVRDAAIELACSVAGKRYRVRLLCDPAFGGGRGKTEQFVDVWAGDAWSAVAGPGQKEAAAAIATFAPSLPFWLAGPFAAQRAAGSFFTLDKAAKKSLFVELLGHGHLRLLHARAVERSKAIAGEHDSAAAAVDRLRVLEARRLELEDAAAGPRATAEQCASDAEQLEADLAAARMAEGDLRQQLAEALAAQRARDARVGELRSARDRQQGAVAQAERLLAEAERDAQIPGTESPMTAAEARAAAVVQRAELEAALALERAATVALGEAERVVREIDDAQLRLDSDIARARAAAKLDGVDMERDVCKVCPLTMRARMAAQEAAELVASRAAGAGESEAALDARAICRMEIGAAALVVNKARAQLHDAEAAEALALDAERTAQQRGWAAALAGERRETLERHRRELAEAQAALEAAIAPEQEDETAALRQRALAAAADCEQTAARLSKLNDARREAERDAAMIEGELAAAVAAIGGADLDAEQARLARLTGQRRAWALLEVALGPNGIQALEIDAAGPAVSQIANDLLADCYGPRFQIRLETTRELKSRDGVAEVFDVAVIDAEAQHVAHGGSGGEMVIVEEALRLALAIYATRHSGRDCRTLFRDEAAGALDQWPGRDASGRYLAMLRAARELGGFHHVHFIAHQPALFEAADGRFVFGGGAVRFEDA